MSCTTEKTLGRLDGKVAFLTGAGAGIAKATAKAFVREGAKVTIAEINEDAGVKEIGDDALFVATDVTSDESVARAIQATVERFGKLNVIMNCAGGSLQEDRPVHEMQLEIWHRTIALNLLHPFLTCRHGIPHMIKGSGGIPIINFASHLGMIGSEKPAYAASKGGIVSFTKTLAAQYVEHGIRANAIAPAIVRTERSIKRWENKDAPNAEKPSAAMRERLMKQKLYPFSIGEPEHVAIAVFLASDESRMLTGTTISADGGRSSYLRVSAE